MSTIDNIKDYSRIDQLGFLAAEIANLTKQADAIKSALKAEGITGEDGEWYHASVSHGARTTTDWHAIAERFEPSRQLIAAHTTTTDVATVRVTARVAKAA